ncbi:MAG: tetratricopeptide repeat protein [Marinoscillum sp.]
MRIFLVATLFCHVLGLYAQQSVIDEGANQTYTNALDNFRIGSYQIAATLFNDYLTNSSNPEKEARYYLAVAKLRSGNQDGIGEMVRFIQSDPLHPLAGGGYFVLGNHYFDQNEHEKALEFYLKVRENQLNVDHQEEWMFKTGYSYYVSETFDKASEKFERVIDFRGKYHFDASYYAGSIHFKNKDYTDALAILEAIDDKDHQYQQEVVLMIASIYYETRAFTRLFKYGEDKLASSSNEAKKELNKLLGDAYFSQKKYDLASTYLQAYIDRSRRTDAQTYFKLAFSYFETGQNQKAIDYFKLAGLEKGELGQISSFYLGQLYMRQENLNYAYSAFKSVMKVDTNPEMVEESAITLAKINFQRQQYADAVSDFTAFIDRFPNSRWRIEANELLAQSYLKTSNYDQAITHLESIKNKSTPLKKAYQKVTFQKGQLLFNDSKFKEAVGFFQKAVSFSMDQEIAAEAQYLVGECYAVLNDYSKAKTAYQACINMRVKEWNNLSRYGLAYIYYNEKNYHLALDYFEAFIQNSFKRDELTIDARLRLADCYYVQKQYDRAIRQYKEVSQPEVQSYINYQLGLCYHLKGDFDMAIASFDQTARDQKSGYADNAMFQKGEVYIEQGKFQQALQAHKSFLTTFQESPLLPYVKNREALCYFNLGQYAQARESYEFILDNHINHETANAALLGLQEIVKKGEKVADFEKYMDSYQRANPDDGSLEVVAFEDAKASYYNQQYNVSIDKLGKFLSKYPKSGFEEDAKYFLADAYFRSQKWRDAEKAFMELIKMNGSSYTSRSLDKRGEALVQLGEYQQAVSNYRALMQKAGNRKETFQAQEGMMNAYFSLDKLDSSLFFADRILEGEWKPVNSASSTWLVKGKIYLKQKNYSQALDEFIQVVNESKNELGAEAKYLMGKTYYEQKQYKRSLELMFDLNKNYGSYPYWVGKSFLLIADNYLGMGELLQAEATTKSIIENASIPEIINEAKGKLKVIEKKEEEVIVSQPADTIK